MYWGKHDDQGRGFREPGRGWSRSDLWRDWRNEGERDWEREGGQWRRERRDWERERSPDESRSDWLNELRDWERQERRRPEEWLGPESWRHGPYARPGREYREVDWRPPGYAYADYARQNWGYGPGGWRERRRDFRYRERGGEDRGGGWWGWRHERRFENRGPKGYKRSDQRIMEDVCDEFMIDDRLDPSEIEVEVLDGVVILRGTVDHRHEKYLAEDIADSVLGVKDVDNRLRLSREAARDRVVREGGERERGERGEIRGVAEPTGGPSEATRRPPEGT
jgi:hypothetical protein